MFSKILIANRGEIACRVIKTLRRLGIQAVAIYSTADRDSLHVSLADEAYCIGSPAASASYLNIAAIIEAAKQSGAEAIHPGYGFLSENVDFAQACADAGLIFIGPPIKALQAMGSKKTAKQLLQKCHVPLTPGYHGEIQSDTHLLQEARQIGFPVLLKAANGGGGKGMRAVEQEDDFLPALAGARREALASFADDTMIIEKLIVSPRHVEIQVMADNFDHVVHLFERDCSIQRRHQKIIEEAPAPNLPATLRKQLYEAALTVVRTIDYRGAGTIEFLVDQEHHFYFMEMNTRLQVEHPVTEMITGLDLVEWQIRIAANQPLPYTQKQLKAQGHAIECRIYAEDPYHEFLPSVGHIHFLREPKGEGLRIDTGVSQQTEITMYYDPMIAKLIAFGENREQALTRLQLALRQYYIGGVKTNIPFLQTILASPPFQGAKLSTHFLQQYRITLPKPNVTLALMLATSWEYLSYNTQHPDPLARATFSWQSHLKSTWCLPYKIQSQLYRVYLTPENQYSFSMEYENETTYLQVQKQGESLSVYDGKQRYEAIVELYNDQMIFYTEHGTLEVKHADLLQATNDIAANNALTAPMPATIVAILKQKGDKILAGERLMVLEAMKMEHTIHAPYDGLLADIFYNVGAQVAEGTQLVTLAAESHEKA